MTQLIRCSCGATFDPALGDLLLTEVERHVELAHPEAIQECPPRAEDQGNREDA